MLELFLTINLAVVTVASITLATVKSYDWLPEPQAIAIDPKPLPWDDDWPPATPDMGLPTDESEPTFEATHPLPTDPLPTQQPNTLDLPTIEPDQLPDFWPIDWQVTDPRSIQLIEDSIRYCLSQGMTKTETLLAVFDTSTQKNKNSRRLTVCRRFYEGAIAKIRQTDAENLRRELDDLVDDR